MNATTRTILLAVFLIASAMSFNACTVFRATGRAVEATGEGAGHAIAKTGDAIERSADETERKF